jgi:PhnB protein
MKNKSKAKAQVKSKAKKKVQPIPKGFHTLTPYLMLRGAAEAIDFYKKAFGAKERFRFPGMDGKSVAHAEMVIGDSIFMMADECPQSMSKSPLTLNGSPVGFVIYTKDTDKAFQRAVDAGAKVKRPLEDMFYGDRSGTVEDPFGHNWTFMTHIEDVSATEIQKRMADFCAKMAQTQAAA